MKKMDYIFAGLVIACSVFCLIAAYAAVSGTHVEIICDNKTYGIYDLNSEQSFKVYASDGHWNNVLISNGTVRVTDADCKDKLCVLQHAISKSGQAIICLPHKVSIRIDGNTDSELDSVAN